ncbi:MAG TPA: SdpI family protein [Nitrospirota bacterium]
MVKRKSLESVIIAIIASQLVAAYLIYPLLPDPMPTHWGMDGEPNGWMSRRMGVAVPIGINLILYLVLFVAPYIDPKRRIGQFLHTFIWIRIVLHLFMSIFFAIAMAAALGDNIAVDRVIPATVSVLIIFLSNYLGKLRPNYFIGIRTPWTLEDPEVWKLTHRASGPVWMGAGIIGLAGSWFGGVVAFGTFFGALLAAGVFSIWYSWKVFRQRTSEQ